MAKNTRKKAGIKEFDIEEWRKYADSHLSEAVLDFNKLYDSFAKNKIKINQEQLNKNIEKALKSRAEITWEKTEGGIKSKADYEEAKAQAKKESLNKRAYNRYLKDLKNYTSAEKNYILSIALNRYNSWKTDLIEADNWDFYSKTYLDIKDDNSKFYSFKHVYLFYYYFKYRSKTKELVIVFNKVQRRIQESKFAKVWENWEILPNSKTYEPMIKNKRFKGLDLTKTKGSIKVELITGKNDKKYGRKTVQRVFILNLKTKEIYMYLYRKPKRYPSVYHVFWKKLNKKSYEIFTWSQ